MQTGVQLKRFLWGWLLTIWSAAAVAAQSTFTKDITAIAPSDIAISVLLAVIGGAAYSSQKVADPAVVIKSNAAEIVKDLLNSLVVGLCFFFFGAWRGWDSFLTAFLITLGGYGGSRVLEPGVEALINKIKALGNKSQ